MVYPSEKWEREWAKYQYSFLSQLVVESLLYPSFLLKVDIFMLGNSRVRWDTIFKPELLWLKVKLGQYFCSLRDQLEIIYPMVPKPRK